MNTKFIVPTIVVISFVIAIIVYNIIPDMDPMRLFGLIFAFFGFSVGVLLLIGSIQMHRFIRKHPKEFEGWTGPK